MSRPCPAKPGSECSNHTNERAGLCCRVIPPGPCNFSVTYRNPGHWDIYTAHGRAFRIRGEGLEVTVSDEREGAKSDWQKFPSVAVALLFCATTLMENPE